MFILGRGRDFILFDARYQTPQEHSHFAKHLIWSRAGLLKCTVAGERVDCRGICIDSGVRHTVEAQPGDAAVMLLEETSTLARRVSELFLRGGAWAALEGDWPDRLEAAREEEALYALLGVERRGMASCDERVSTALNLIQDSETIETGLPARLAEAVCLSPSRFSHLFRREVGVSLAGYLAMEKLCRAYSYVQQGESLTDAAVHAGFSSASHFAAAHRARFGVACTEFLSSFAK